MQRASWAFAWMLAGCGELAVDLAEQAAVICGKGPTVKGIDVSYYQGNIDWAAARADGVEFAFIRASDGLGYIDSKFEQNWAAAGAQGILRGTYQFFRPAQDPIAQAELVLGKLAAAPGELPPVIDVEDADGLAPEAVEAAVRAWIDRVRAAIGRDPIIYTGFYFWRDEVGAPDLTASPLWHAQYTSAACPNIAPPWADWAFWQFTSTGRVAGIDGDVDINRWNGAREDLAGFAAGAARLCGVVGPEGGEIDDGDPCFTGGGPPEFLRRVEGTGAGDDLIWTYTTASRDEVSFGHWNLVLAEAGRYRVEVSTPAPYAQSSRARYAVTAAGVRHELSLDQSASSGWQVLGELDFAAGGGQSIHLGDNTGESAAAEVQLVLDGIRLVRVPPAADDGDGAGCSTGGSGRGAGALVLGLVLLVPVRRRRRPPRRAIPGRP